MPSATVQKLSLFALTGMVIGSMVGSGIFSLPRTFGTATGPFGAIIAWVIAAGGMYTLARVFQSLAERKPDLDAGVYAYAKAGFGDYPGFLSALGHFASPLLVIAMAFAGWRTRTASTESVQSPAHLPSSNPALRDL
jgi:amino acid transporter